MKLRNMKATISDVKFWIIKKKKKSIILGHTADINNLSGVFYVLNFLNQNSNLNIYQYISILNGCNYVVYLCYWVSGICPSSNFMNRTHIMWLRCSFWQMQLSSWLSRFSPEDGNRSNFQRLCNSKNFTLIEYGHNSVNVSFVLIFFLRFHLRRMRRWQRMNQMVQLIEVQYSQCAGMRQHRTEVNNNGHPEEGNSNASSLVIEMNDFV